MAKFIQWLGINKLIAVMLAVIVYFSIVTFHDEITVLAIRLRNAIGRDKYNEFLAYGFLALFLVVLVFLFYHAYRSRQRYLNLAFSVIVMAMIFFSFRYLMVYSIEAIHFVEYMLVAMLLLPVLKSYGGTVFWVTILGILDELFQYFFLTPNFEYFDYNDVNLNLIGAGAGAVMIFVFAGHVIRIKPVKWYQSVVFITAALMLAIFFILLLTGKMTIDPVESSGSHSWFSLNRVKMPDEFWTTAYPGRTFHILRPLEGIVVMYLLFIGFFGLDYLHDKDEERK